MEKEKENYLEYFLNTKKTKMPSNSLHYKSQPRLFTDQYKQQSYVKPNKNNKSCYYHKKVKKTLPHIKEEYQYKITNKLLVQKIMNPKRNKLIMESFHQKEPNSKWAGSVKQNNSLLRVNSSDPNMRKIRSLQMRTREHLTMHEEGKMGHYVPSSSLHEGVGRSQQNSRVASPHDNKARCQKSFNLALQNERMGRRIINTKSSVEQILKKTYFTYKNQQSSSSSSKDCNSLHASIQGPYMGKTDPHQSFIRGNQNQKHYFHGKINNGVKIFFNQEVNDESEHGSEHEHGLQRKNIIQENSQCQEQDNVLQVEKDSEENNGGESKSAGLKKQHKIFKMNHCRKPNHPIEQKLEMECECEEQSVQFIETHFPEFYKPFGKGPTILMLYNFQIECNPKIKDETMLLFELITKQSHIQINKCKEKFIKTPPITYEFLKKKWPMKGQESQIKPKRGNQNTKMKESPNGGLKFAINMSQIGDFVPFRLYRVNGVSIQQMGIIDINLSLFKYRKCEQMRSNMVTELKINENGETLERDVIVGSLSDNLRKRRSNKIQIKVKLDFKIYPKRFK